MVHCSGSVDSARLLAPQQQTLQQQIQMAQEMNHSQEAHHAQESAKNVELDGQNAFQNLYEREDGKTRKKLPQADTTNKNKFCIQSKETYLQNNLNCPKQYFQKFDDPN